jgi:hypothetical protein
VGEKYYFNSILNSLFVKKRAKYWPLLAKFKASAAATLGPPAVCILRLA